MYINSLHLEKYKVLKNLEIDFQIPKDNKNIVNVIAGINGSGKTSLLEYLMAILSCSFFYKNKHIEGNRIFNGEMVFNNQKIDKQNYINTIYEQIPKYKNENRYEKGIHSSPRIIYIQSTMSFDYKEESSLETTYQFSNIIDSNKILGKAELFIKNHIISNIMNSNEAKPNQEIKREIIDKFNSTFKDSEFVTKLVDLDIHNNNKPIFETIEGEKITIDELSSGEQQLYARVISLMILNPQNSIILIDEPEIALHPKWQIEIMKIYSNIGRNNQFIVTTHSPFIISQTSYKNLIFLVKESEKIVAKNFIKPPNNRDINTIIETMGANYELKEVKELHSQYRELVENDKIDTKEAENIKNRILEFENENSKFFQSINFYLEFSK